MAALETSVREARAALRPHNKQMTGLRSGRPTVRCRCVWGERCPNTATQEDGLCDWCGERRPEDLVGNPNALISPDGEFMGLGGRGESHVDTSRTPDACWM